MGDIAPVELGNVANTQRARRTAEIALYHMADAVNRLLVDGVPYTKVAVQQPLAPPAQPQLQPPGWTYGSGSGSLTRPNG